MGKNLEMSQRLERKSNPAYQRMLTNLAAEIKQFIESFGDTSYQFAKKAGYNPAKMYQITKGMHMPSFMTVETVMQCAAKQNNKPVQLVMTVYPDGDTQITIEQ